MITHHVYEDGRLVRTVTPGAWTSEDRALILAYRRWKASFCTGCGQSKAKAWHPDNDGWFEVDESVVCHACTALANADSEPGKVKPVTKAVAIDTRDYTKDPLPPWPSSAS